MRDKRVAIKKDVKKRMSLAFIFKNTYTTKVICGENNLCGKSDNVGFVL